MASKLTKAAQEIKEAFKSEFYPKVEIDYDNKAVRATLEGDVIKYGYWINLKIIEFQNKYPDITFFIDY